MSFKDICEDVLKYHILPWRTEICLYDLECKKQKSKQILEDLDVAHYNSTPNLKFEYVYEYGLNNCVYYHSFIEYDDLDIKKIYISNLSSRYFKIECFDEDGCFLKRLMCTSYLFTNYIKKYEYNELLKVIKNFINHNFNGTKILGN